MSPKPDTENVEEEMTEKGSPMTMIIAGVSALVVIVVLVIIIVSCVCNGKGDQNPDKVTDCKKECQEEVGKFTKAFTEAMLGNDHCDLFILTLLKDGVAKVTAEGAKDAEDKVECIKTHLEQLSKMVGFVPLTVDQKKEEFWKEGAEIKMPDLVQKTTTRLLSKSGACCDTCSGESEEAKKYHTGFVALKGAYDKVKEQIGKATDKTFKLYDEECAEPKKKDEKP